MAVNVLIYIMIMMIMIFRFGRLVCIVQDTLVASVPVPVHPVKFI